MPLHTGSIKVVDTKLADTVVRYIRQKPTSVTDQKNVKSSLVCFFCNFSLDLSECVCSGLVNSLWDPTSLYCLEDSVFFCLCLLSLPLLLFWTELLQGWAKELELSWEKVSALLQPATASHAWLVLSKTVPFSAQLCIKGLTLLVVTRYSLRTHTPPRLN